MSSISPFRRTIHVGDVKCDGKQRPVHVFIKYSHDGRLSISGVTGAKADGDAYGSCGKNIEDCRRCDPDLAAIWERWHLNDMRAACEHQRAAGWIELAERKVTLYHWRLNSDAIKCQRENKDDALACLMRDGRVDVSDEWLRFQALPHSVTTHTPEAPGPEYEPKSPLFAGDEGPTTTKALGWLRPSEHPDGILCKPCPTCGHQYGSKWLREEVPQDILARLQTWPSKGAPCPTRWLRER